MADNVRFLSGGIGNLDKQPITPGNIYFALSDDKTYGYIVYDFKDSNNSNSRIVMSAKAKTAGQVEFPLVIGEYSYDGSERIEIPIYDGSSESGGECFDISLLDNMLVFDNDKIWLIKDGKIDKTAPIDFGPAANESIKTLSDRLNNIESDYLTTTDKDQVVTMVSNEALERKSQIGDIGDITVKEYVDNKTYDVATTAELADIRIKADGTTADTAGNAVREQISELKSDKVNILDIVDNLTSSDVNKPLSANQGKLLNDIKVNISDIKDNLTSTNTDKPLSANQGKVLNDTFKNYYNKTEVDQLVVDTQAIFYGDGADSLTVPINADLLEGHPASYFIEADSDLQDSIIAEQTARTEAIDAITTSKVNVSDIIDNLTTNLSNKVLSASMGVELKKLIDAIKIPVNLSELAGDTTHRTVTDTEKTAWNNKSTFSGNYNDLTGKPTLITEERVNELINAKLPKSAEEVQY